MRVNEIFYSLQGEGHFTGTPAVFVRLSGCNLACTFCDTDHRHGVELTDSEIVAAVNRYPARHVVITGGEPTLQLTASLVGALHESGHFVQIETNGSLEIDPQLADAIDWITCSPKLRQLPAIQRIDELKMLFDTATANRITFFEQVRTSSGTDYFLQPCDRSDAALTAANLRACIDYILAHPRWRLSLQTHKLINIP